MLKTVKTMETIAYFDNAATTFPKPEKVYQFADKFYRECGVNVGRGQHKLSAKASALVDETRTLLLELNHCPNRTIVFNPSATEALNLVLRSVIRRKGSNVFITPFEHNAVTRVLNYIKQSFEINIYTLPFDKHKECYDLIELDEKFREIKPDCVIMSHASNVCGLIAPIYEICGISKKYGATNIIDMCQTMGLIDTNLNNEDIDYAVFAAHKTLYGSFGLGGFICKSELRPDPLLYGGTGVDSANPLLPDDVPARYEVGSQNIHAIAGLNAALNWIKEIGIQNIYEKEKRNHKRLISILQQYNNIKLYSPVDVEKGIGVLSAVFDGFSSDNIGQILSNKDVAVRTGLHCAPDAHRFLGTFPSGTVRFSVGFFNTDNDFNTLDKALKYILDNS